MRALIDLLLKNPILLFIIGAWLVGMIGNVAKARRKARERREAQTRPQPVPPLQTGVSTQRPVSGPTTVARAPSSAPKSAEEVAREMRRILGLEPAGGAQPTARGSQQQARMPGQSQRRLPRQARADLPTADGAPPLPQRIRRVEVTEPERAPTAVHPSTGDRKLDRHVDPHVGERIRDRHMQRSKVGQPRAGRSAMGSLGGRVKKSGRRAAAGSRYALDDLRTAIVLSEILGPPVTLRPYDERRPH